ncbi:MAG: hypothetical protein R3C11_24775 [Planctomycetaceae bacterium]
MSDAYIALMRLSQTAAWFCRAVCQGFGGLVVGWVNQHRRDRVEHVLEEVVAAVSPEEPC